MALLAATTKLFSRRPGATFAAGVIFGILLVHIYRGVHLHLTTHQETRAPRSFLSLPEQGVSHAPTVLKRVLAARDELPHITQIAFTTLHPGQVATKNW